MRLHGERVAIRVRRALDIWRPGATAAHLSVDFGSSCIKAVESVARAGRLGVLNAICFETPPESVSNGVVRDGPVVGAALRRNLQKAGIKTAQATTCIPGSAAVVKRLTLPLADAARLEGIVCTEIESLASFGSDSLLVDYQVTEGAADETLDVLVAAARQETVGAYANAMKAADLRLRAIDIDSLALANLVDAAYGVDPSRTLAFVHVGAELCAFGIRSHGAWVMSGSVGVGARRVVPSYLVEEIDGALRFHWPASAADRFDEILLSGGGAGTPQLAGSLAERWGRPVRIIELNRVVAEPGACDAALFAVATGLAVRWLVTP